MEYTKISSSIWDGIVRRCLEAEERFKERCAEVRVNVHKCRECRVQRLDSIYTAKSVKASKLDLPARRTEQFLLTYFGTNPPVFFINIMTSDSLKLPRASVPIVS